MMEDTAHGPNQKQRRRSLLEFQSRSWEGEGQERPLSASLLPVMGRDSLDSVFFEVPGLCSSNVSSQSLVEQS